MVSESQSQVNLNNIPGEIQSLKTETPTRARAPARVAGKSETADLIKIRGLPGLAQSVNPSSPGGCQGGLGRARPAGAKMPTAAPRRLPLPSWAVPDALRPAWAAGRAGLRSEAQEAVQAREAAASRSLGAPWAPPSAQAWPSEDCFGRR